MLIIRPRHVLRSTIYIVAGIAILLFSILFAPAVSARSTQQLADGPTILKASIGFDGIYQDGNWTPIQIDLSNSGNDFTGKISINVPSAAIPGPSMAQSANAYQEPINLPPGAKKQVTISVPVNLNAQGANAQISVDLLDEAGHRVAHQAILNNNNNANLTLIGVLSDTPNNFGQLNLALSNLFSTSGQLKNLSAASLPKQAQVLKNFDAIIIDNFTSSSLSQDQLGALQSWVNQGGNLIVTGGPEWKRNLSALPGSLLPVTIQGNGTLAADKHLLPVNTLTKSDQAANDSVKATVPISLAQATPNSTTLLSDGKTPLIVQKVLGQGTVAYLAYDPTLEPLASWQQTNQLWSTLLLRSLSEHVLTNANSANVIKGQFQGGMGYFPGMAALLQTFFPNAYPSIWLILGLLLSYVAILGPIRLLLVRVLKRRSWSWRIVLTTIVVFTLLSYGMALQQKGSSIINSSITLLQLNAPDKTGSSGHSTTWLGVFVPSQGDFQVHVPGASLVQPVEQMNNMYYSPYNSSGSTQNSIFTVGNNSTDINLKGVDIWTTRSLLTQQDTHIPGGITSQLQLQNNAVSGTVTSTLPYTLTDAFVLVGNSYVAIGDLPSNSTKQININLKSNSSPSANNLTLADQIANSRGLISNPNDGYYGSYGSNLPKDIPHRHVMMLEALSGGSCDNTNCYHQGVQIISSNGVVMKRFMQNNGNNISISDRDPLLLPGAPATIIGWAQNVSNNAGDITVNGQSTNGSQDTMVQAPLDLKFSGPITLPSSVINSQIVHIQQNTPGSVQEPMPGTYMISSGNMTIEYTLPTAAALQDSQLTLTSSATPTKNVPMNLGVTSDINHVQSYLYNWQKQSWDAISFNQFSCSVKNARAYIGPDGRILLHLNNHDTNAVFDKPALEIQGTVTH